MKEKNKIRSEYRTKRDAMPDALVRQSSDTIAQYLLDWELYQNAQRVFFYYPLGKEVSLLPVIQEALRAGRHCAFPKTFGDKMAFYEISDLRELKEGRFHVMEPQAEGDKPDLREPDLCFVPGLAFDLAGGRLGYGKGYYDRYFAHKGAAVLVGCAFSCQIADRLMVDAWDIRMDYLVSEQGIITLET